MRVFVLLFFLISFSITANAINENKLDSSWYPLSTDISFGGLQYFSINGDTFNIELLDIQTTIDTIKEAIRSATVTVRISKGKKIGFADTAKNSQLSGLRNKVTIKIVCGNYTLPTTLSDFGIQIECTVVRNYLRNSNHNDWAIEKDARLRIYPYTGRFIKEGVFGFPLDAKLFSSKTQMGNEPTYVGGESLSRQKIYYHSDLDFGGVDGLVNLYSTTDGVVLSIGTNYDYLLSVAPNIKYEFALRPLKDQILILDPMGFLHVYAHLNSFATELSPGSEVRKGDFIGTLGKKGGSGNWSHLHYGMYAQQLSGQMARIDPYPFIVQSYIDEYKPAIIAVARPHKFTFSGDEVLLSGANTYNNSNHTLYYEWNVAGEVLNGKNVNVIFDKPGSYSAILKAYNNYDYDYDSVSIKVLDKNDLRAQIPNVYPTFHPSKEIQINNPVIFQFRTTGIGEFVDLSTEFDFGDGFIKNVFYTGPGDNSIVHRYLQAGHYIVGIRTKTTNKNNPHKNIYKSTEFLFVKVSDNN